MYAPEWDARLRDAIRMRDEFGGFYPIIRAAWLSRMASCWHTSQVMEMLGDDAYHGKHREKYIPQCLPFDFWSLGVRFAAHVREGHYRAARGALQLFCSGIDEPGMRAARVEARMRLQDITTAGTPPGAARITGPCL